jgi:sugar transferase EpsL
VIFRIRDFIVASIALVCFLPMLIVLSILIRGFLGSPILFTQVRPGLRGDPFVMLKFRSMTSAKDADGNFLPDDQRLTPFGVALRSTSLDELPSLWSVLNGDMSLVGPRPLLNEYLPLYSPKQARRHDIKPGITGWAQVNGRNAISWEEKFVLDVWYVDNQSLWLDAKILFLTLRKVFVREGISAAGEATMAKFTGSSVNE